MDGRFRTCCFTGHRPAKLPWGFDETDWRCLRLKTAIDDALRAVYDDGCRHFLCGMALGADMYFGEAVAALRDERPDVTLEAVIPFDGQDLRWSAPLRERYARLTEQCDELTVLRGEYTQACMLERNRHMVDRSSILIAAYDGRPGGTRSTVLYAKKRGLEIICLPIEPIPTFS